MIKIDLTKAVAVLTGDGVWRVLSGDGNGVTVSDGVELDRNGEVVVAPGLWVLWTDNTGAGPRRVITPASTILGIRLED